MNQTPEANRVCPYDATPLTRMWEFVAGGATTEVKNDSGSYFHRLFIGDSARGYPYVCSECGLLLYFLDVEGLSRVLSNSGNNRDAE